MWWRNPRLIGGAVLLVIILVSQGVEQFTYDVALGKSRYPTPPLLARIIELVAVAMFTAGSLTEVAKMWFSSKGNKHNTHNQVEPRDSPKDDDDVKPQGQEGT